MLGFDVVYRNDVDDAAIIDRARTEGRIILTRDTGILKHGDVTHGYWVRSTDPETQLREVVDALSLHSQFEPFSRCLVCNAVLEDVAKEEIADRLPTSIRTNFDVFRRCTGCGRLYWQGSHYERMERLIASLE